MKQFRALAVTLLALAVMASSVTMATARHQPRPVGEMVLCTGYGMVVVSVDAHGQPTGPMMPCPDCVPALAGLEGTAAILPQPALTLRSQAHTLRNLPAPARGAAVFRHPRAPPAAV